MYSCHDPLIIRSVTLFRSNENSRQLYNQQVTSLSVHRFKTKHSKANQPRECVNNLHLFLLFGVSNLTGEKNATERFPVKICFYWLLKASCRRKSWSTFWLHWYYNRALLLKDLSSDDWHVIGLMLYLVYKWKLFTLKWFRLICKVSKITIQTLKHPFLLQRGLSGEYRTTQEGDVWALGAWD